MLHFMALYIFLCVCQTWHSLVTYVMTSFVDLQTSGRRQLYVCRWVLSQRTRGRSGQRRRCGRTRNNASGNVTYLFSEMILISTKGCFLMIGFVGAIVLWGGIFLHSLTLFISIWKCPTNKKSNHLFIVLFYTKKMQQCLKQQNPFVSCKARFCVNC